MIRKATFMALMGLFATASICWSQDCMIYNWSATPYTDYAINTNEHEPPPSFGGSHAWASTGTGSCTYGNYGSLSCSTRAVAKSTANLAESSSYILAIPLNVHVDGWNTANGTSTSLGGSASAQSTAGGGVRSCLFGTCNVTVTMSGPGGSVTINPDAIWQAPTEQNSIGCEGESRGDPPTPILIDAYGEGFHLTDASHGVKFDVKATGNPIGISWTDPKHHNGWLALDRNGNGKIDSGAELFGDVTPQPKAARPPNGYLALGYFDTAAAGGNGNGVIDPGDAVFSQLRVWIDANQDGISQPEELHTLSELDINQLAYKFDVEWNVDHFGNIYRLKAPVQGDLPPGLENARNAGGGHSDGVGRWSHDVFLVKAE